MDALTDADAASDAGSTVSQSLRHRRSTTTSRGVSFKHKLTAEMFQQEEPLDPAFCMAVVLKASEIPAVLVGWKIALAEGDGDGQADGLGHAGEFVVTNTRKNVMWQTEYEIANMSEHRWVRLHRGKDKPGVQFQLLKKVDLSNP
jgi:hypothetical protein